MKIIHRIEQDSSVNPLELLKQCTDGYLIIGYLPGSNEKFAQGYAKNKACRDALNTFDPLISGWMEIGEFKSDKED